MKLAEALINRADAQKRIQQLQDRLNRVARVQEGEAPAEDPQELLTELERTLTEFNRLVKQINRTNASTAFDDNTTLTDALADRDTIGQEHRIITGLINSAAQSNFRYTRSEIKIVSTINVAQLQKRADDLSRDYRVLDSRIQQMNWSIDLIED